MNERDYVGASTVCPASNPFLRLLVVRRGDWWVVDDQSTGECLTGGYATKTEAVEWARQYEPGATTKSSGEVVDLLAALQRSVDAAKAARTSSTETGASS